MLYYLGKDVLRWMVQCQDLVERTPELVGSDLQVQSFAELLTGNPPDNVREKLLSWGVADYASVFASAIGLEFHLYRTAQIRSAGRRIPRKLSPLQRCPVPLLYGVAAFPEYLGRKLSLRPLCFR